jgi:hypothetical protein
MQGHVSSCWSLLAAAFSIVVDADLAVFLLWSRSVARSQSDHYKTLMFFIHVFFIHRAFS